MAARALILAGLSGFGVVSAQRPDLRIIVAQGPHWYPRAGRDVCTQNVSGAGCLGGVAALAARFRDEAAGARATLRLVGPDISTLNLWHPAGWSVNELIHQRLGCDSAIIDNAFPLSGENFDSVYRWVGTSRRSLVNTNYALGDEYTNSVSRHLMRGAVLQAGGIRVGVLVVWPPGGWALTIPLHLAVRSNADSLRKDGVDIVLMICGEAAFYWDIYKVDEFVDFGVDIVLPPLCNNRTGCADEGDATFINGTFVAPGIDRGQVSPYGAAYAVLDIMRSFTGALRAVSVRSVPLLEELPDSLRDSWQHRADLDWMQRAVANPALDNNPLVGRSNGPMPWSSIRPATGSDYACRKDMCVSGVFTVGIIHERLPEYDIVLYNAGAFRGPGWETGPVTLRDIYDLLPFQNELCAFNTTGPELYRIVEMYIQDVAPDGTYNRTSRYRGAFPQTSGLRFEFDPLRPKLKKLLLLEVRGPGGVWEPVRRTRLYSVVTSDFLCNGGDHFDIQQIGARHIPLKAQDLIIEAFKQAGNNGLTPPEKKTLKFNGDPRPTFALHALGPADCSDTQRHVPQWSECVDCPQGMVRHPIDPTDCSHPPAAADDRAWLWAVIAVSALIVLVAPPVAWKLTSNWRRIRKLHSKEVIAVSCAESIAAMRFEEVEYVRQIPNPDRIQRAFIDIISVLTHYRAFLPQSVLVDDDLVSEAGARSPCSPKKSHRRETNPLSPAAVCQSPRKSHGSPTHDPSRQVSRLSFASDEHSSRFSGRGSRASVSGILQKRQSVSLIARAFCFLDTSLTRKAVTLLWAGAEGTHARIDGAGSQVDAASFNSVLVAMLAAVDTSRGVVDHISGDRVVSSFGAVRMNLDQVRPCQCATDTAAAVKGLVGGGHVGLEKGTGYVGTLGTEAQRKVSIIGVTANVAYACSRVARQHSVPVVAGARIAQDTHAEVEYWALCALRSHKLAPRPPNSLLLFELVRVRGQLENDEWMYQLEKVQREDPYAEHNQAMRAALSGAETIAREAEPETLQGEPSVTEDRPPPDRAAILTALTASGPLTEISVDVAF